VQDRREPRPPTGDGERAQEAQETQTPVVQARAQVQGRRVSRSGRTAQVRHAPETRGSADDSERVEPHWSGAAGGRGLVVGQWRQDNRRRAPDR